MKRRHFLSSIAAIPVLSSLRSRQNPGPTSNRHGLKLGTVTYNIAKDWDVPTIIKNLTEAGFDAVELRTTHKHGVEIALSPAARAEVRKRFEDSPVKIGGLGTTCEYHSPDPAVVRKNIDETKEWVKLAQDIGSPSVKVRPNGLPKDVPEEKTLEQIGKALAECGAVRAGQRRQDPARGARRGDLAAAAHPQDPRLRREPPRRSRLLELEPDGPARRRLRGELPLVRDQIGQVHMRDLFLEEYPWRRLITSLSEMKFERLLLRGDSRVRRSRAGARSISGACSARIRICTRRAPSAYGTQAALPLSRNGSPAATTNSQV